MKGKTDSRRRRTQETDDNRDGGEEADNGLTVPCLGEWEGDQPQGGG